MSRFNLKIATELAKQSYRFRVDHSPEQRVKAMLKAPLLGKEVRLLEVLQEAEALFDEWEQLGPVVARQRDLLAKFAGDCERLLCHLERTVECWSDMRKYDGHYDLACRAQGDLGRPETAYTLLRVVDDALQILVAGAKNGREHEQFPHPRGPRAGKNERLLQFTKVVRLFWLGEVSKRFGYDDGIVDQEDERLEVTSAAARLLYGAARVLDQSYTPAIVREVMEAAARSHPDPL